MIIILIGIIGLAGIPRSDAFNGGGMVIEVPGQTMDISQNVISPGETMFVNGSFKQPVGDFTTNIFKNYEDSRKLVLTLNSTTNESGDFNFNFTIPPYWELGNYYMILENGLQFMDWDFAVRKNYSDASLDPTVYPIQKEILSPLQQFKDGTFSNKITCKKDLELIIKYNGIPSCVKPTSLVRLTTNGWYYPATNNPSQYIGSGFDKNAQTAIQIALQNQQVQNLLEKQNTVIRSVHGTLTNESNCAVNYCTVINIDQLGTRETLVVIVDITNKTVDSIHTTPHWGTSQEGIDSSNCNLEPESGFCKAAIEKYYFDAEYNLCKSFTWGGCGGVVPFDTLDDCHVMCK